MLLLIGISCLGALADAVLKLASAEQNLLRSKWLLVGLSLSCGFAISWVFLMREMKLATAGIVYGVASAVLLCVVGSCSSTSGCLEASLPVLLPAPSRSYC